MGMRQNIGMKYSDNNKVYVYSHWGGENGMSPLKKKLQRALKRQQRWDDESYLARIIISEVIKLDIDDEVGYGIAPYPLEEEYPTIEVDFEKKTVDGMPFNDFINLTE